MAAPPPAPAAALDSRDLAGEGLGHRRGADQARTYLRHEAGNSFDAARVDAFLTTGPEAVDFFTTKTALAFDMPLTFPTTTPKRRAGRKAAAPW